MSDTSVKYNTLDLQALLSKKSKIVSSEEALRNVEPALFNELLAYIQTLEEIENIVDNL